MIIELFGFLLPLEWVLGIGITIIVMMPLALFGIIKMIWGGEDKGPDEEDMAAVIPVDEHDTIQRGKLIGNLQRTEDELILTHPDWIDDEGNEYQDSADIKQKVPFPLSDASGREKRLWIVRDKGNLDVVSASTIVSEKIPKRWDLPLVDPRRIFRHLEGPHSGSSITNALTTKTGIITLIGILLLGSTITVTILTASGHIK